MNTIILNQYKIEFQKVKFMGNFIKTMNSPHLILNQFAIDTTSEYDLNDTIEALNSVLTGVVLNLTFSTDSFVTVDITNMQTKFYAHPEFNETTPVLFSIPTNDFKEIIMSWKEYLEL
jgi:hypothetical protein